MRIGLAVLTLLALGGTGCGTLKNLSGGTGKVPGPAIYGGIRVNAAEMHHNTAHHPCYACFFCADMPFSFVLDTILLPVTIPIVLLRKGSPVPPRESLLDVRRRMEEAKTITVRFVAEREALETPKVVAKGTLLLKMGNKVRLELTVTREEKETAVLFVSDGGRMRATVGDAPPVTADAPEGMEKWYREVLHEVGVLENHWLPPGNIAGLALGSPVKVTMKVQSIRGTEVGPHLYVNSISVPQTEAFEGSIKTDYCWLGIVEPSIHCGLWRTYDTSTLALLGRKVRMEENGAWIRETYDEFRYDDEIPDDRFKLPE